MTVPVPVLSYGPATKAGVVVDLERLVASRLLLQANSGGGKSRAIRQLLEETHGRVQHLVIDPEGEFATLREALPYVLAAKEGDVPASPKTAKLLCRKLMELGASAVLDLYDLSQDERRQFVKGFLTELMALPRTLWRPLLVVIDEAHIFCPERGSGEAQSTDAVITLCTQGRKRGYCAVLATQRISKLHKDAAAELLNKLVGRTGLDVDVKRAGDDLGFDKEQRQALKTLAPGEFFTYGPAIAPAVQRVRTGPVRTSHPEAAAQLGSAPPPAPAQLQGILAQLGDLPKEAEAEARTVEALTQEVAALRRQLTLARREAPAPSEEVIASHVHRAVRDLELRMEHHQRAFSADVVALQSVPADLRETADRLDRHLAAMEAALQKSVAFIPSPTRVAASEPEARPRAPMTGMPARGGTVPSRHTGSPGDRALPSGERDCLIALAQHPDGVSREQLSILAGYKRSTRDSYIQRLRSRGLCEVDGLTIRATPAGIAALGDDYEPLPVGDALREHWLARLPEGEARILEVVCGVWPDAMDRAAVSGETHYKRSTRDSYIQRLSARRLVQTTPDGVRAADTLFDAAGTARGRR